MFIYGKPLLNRGKYKRTVSEKYAKQCTNRLGRRVSKHNIKNEQYDKCIGGYPFYGYFND